MNIQIFKYVSLVIKYIPPLSFNILIRIFIHLNKY